ncbi:MAG: archaeosine synthase subunit alpha [Candidatus Thermoplasmatota archaeon]|nr:archaeosine synthase subunit alpha [Candidatus Thermoplasmatota archaeon]
MKFEVLKRDCTARIGTLEINGNKITTPHILWYSSERVKAPPFASVFLSRARDGLSISHSGSFFYPLSNGDSIPPSFVYPYALPSELHEIAAEWNERHASTIQIISGKALDNISEDAMIYVLSNARELFSNPRNFVKAITDVREAIDYQKILYAPGLGEPSHIAILSYCTVDLFDSISLVEKARKKIFLFPEDEYNADELGEIPCSCPACLNENLLFSGILMHNYYAAFSELKNVRNAIKNNRLRNLVEIRASSQPKIASILRILDREYYEFQEKRYPVIGGKIVASPLSMDRPDVERFRRRVLEQYIKPGSAKILVLLPCSARKPYSFSKSHRIFRNAIESCGNPGVVHEVVVTSPLGIVPIELEMVYPAAHYDISVTGHWSLDEQEMVKKQLSSYLKRNDYDIVINHLPEEISEFLEVEGAIKTCIGHPISNSSINSLSILLKKEATKYGKIPKNLRKSENVKSFLSYQFGNVEGMLEGCKARGKYPGYKIFCDDVQIGMFVESKGLFSLTLEGGRRLADAGIYRVEIEDFVPRGSIFAVGVTNSDKNIRCGDEVVALHGGDIRAVGMALMSGEEMVMSNTGEAVKVRHHKKD